MLQPIGSLFFAGAAEFEEHLPDPAEASHATVILRLRDVDELGSTFIRVLERYAKKLKETDNRLMLAGVSGDAYDQLQKTGVLEVIGSGNVFRESEEFGFSMREAMLTAGAPQVFPEANRLQVVESNLQQSIVLLNGEAESSGGERKSRLERNRDQLTPIAQDVKAFNQEEKNKPPDKQDSSS